MIKNLNDSSEKKTSYIDTSNLRKLQSCLCGTNVVIRVPPRFPRIRTLRN